MHSAEMLGKLIVCGPHGAPEKKWAYKGYIGVAPAEVA